MDTVLDTKLHSTKNAKPVKQDSQAIDTITRNGVLQIRDILLGEHISTWENRIVNIEQDVEDLIKKTDAKLAKMSDSIEKFLEKADSQLKSLDEQLIKFSQQAEAKLKTLDDRISEADKNMKEELEMNLMDLEQENADLRTMVEEFRSDLEQSFSSKVDKRTLAEALTFWVNSLNTDE